MSKKRKLYDLSFKFLISAFFAVKITWSHALLLTCLYSQFLLITGAPGFLLMELDRFPKLWIFLEGLEGYKLNQIKLNTHMEKKHLDVLSH